MARVGDKNLPASKEAGYSNTDQRKRSGNLL
jgi:hypothetical protein